MLFRSTLLPKKMTAPTLLFVGSFYWLQNTEAATYLAERIFPLIKNDIPDVRLIIAGQNAKNKISEIQKEGIKIIDIAPDDSNAIKDLYQHATLFLAPIFGPGGTRLKILAAMASGLPIITTTTGIEGLSVEPGVHVLIANKEEEFVKMIKRALSDKKLYENMRKKSYDLVKEKYRDRKSVV